MRKKSQTASLPMPSEMFSQLLDSLDQQLNEVECDHSLRFTEDFLADADGVDGDEVVAWLVDRGGVCDCEVLANLEDDFRS
jgi:Protein of unknown function (DUF2695)